MQATELVHVPFSGLNLPAIQVGKTVWVPVTWWCSQLGLDVDSQRKRLHQEPWANLQKLVVSHDDATKGEVESTSPSANAQETLCLDLDTLPMWLATIQVGKVKEEAQGLIIKFQKEAARALREFFFPTDFEAIKAVAAPEEDASLIRARAALQNAEARLLREKRLAGLLPPGPHSPVPVPPPPAIPLEDRILALVRANPGITATGLHAATGRKLKARDMRSALIKLLAQNLVTMSAGRNSGNHRMVGHYHPAVNGQLLLPTGTGEQQ